jgi:hypothetical protein
MRNTPLRYTDGQIFELVIEYRSVDSTVEIPEMGFVEYLLHEEIQFPNDGPL